MMISIVMLNFNSPNDTIECINSLMEDEYKNFEILLIDNGSTDNSSELFKNLKNDKVKFIQNEKNLGFPEGNNIGIKKSIGDYIVLLNNDTIVEKNFITKLSIQIETHPDIGIFGPKIYYYYEPNKIWFAGGILDWKLGGAHIGIDKIDKDKIDKDKIDIDKIDIDKIDNGSYKKEKYVDFITGCALIIKREIIDDIGYLDSSFLFYYEDVDFCIRARNAGYKCLYIPTPVLWHKIGTSINRDKEKINQPQLYLGTRNKFISIRKNYSGLQYSWFLLKNLIIFSPVYILSLILKRDYDLLYAYIYGISDGLKRITPERFVKL